MTVTLISKHESDAFVSIDIIKISFFFFKSEIYNCLVIFLHMETDKRFTLIQLLALFICSLQHSHVCDVGQT